MDIRMVKDFSVSDVIHELNKGKKIKCFKCNKGWYITKEGCIGKSHSFWCSECNDLLHVTPSDITVK